MWRTALNKSIREVRFVLKQTPEHHGVWHFVRNKLPELRMLNQNTYFVLTEINHHFDTPSSCHILYGDGANTEEDIETAGLSSEAFEQMLKEKVAKGLTLERAHVGNNEDRELPVSTVEARKYVKYMDDGF